MYAQMNASTTAPAVEPSEELCFVCNDASTGYHYGTPSCNGCKTFFRRTVIKNQTFICQYGGKCIIDKGIRCACRHCRFAKCLAVGMSKDAIQQNRDPIGYTKRTRRYPPLQLTTGSSSSAASVDRQLGNGPTTSSLSVGVEQTSPRAVTKQIGSLAEAEDRLIEELGRIEERVRIVRNSQIFVQKSFLEIMLRPSIFHDRELVERHAQMPYSDVQLRRARHSDHMYWHERDWVNLIEWAKTIPVYETLSFSDKLALLRHSAIAYPSLNQCFYSKVIDMDTVVFPNGVFFDRMPEADRPVSLQRKKIKVFNNLLRPIRKMQLDVREFATAKTIFFLNADADELSSEARQRVNEARGAITNALYRYMVGGGRDGESVDRFAKLLLLGTAISTIIVESKEAVVVVNFFEQMQFSQLAKHLLLNAEDEEEGTADAAPASAVQDCSGDGTGTSVTHTESDRSLSDRSPSWDGASAGCLSSAFSGYQLADSSAGNLAPFHRPAITITRQASSSDPTASLFTVKNGICTAVVRSMTGQ